MAGRYIFRQLSAPDAGRSAGNCEQVSLGIPGPVLLGVITSTIVTTLITRLIY